MGELDNEDVLRCVFFIPPHTVVSKPADCIFPYDFKEAVRKKVKFRYPFICVSILWDTNTVIPAGIEHAASYCIKKSKI